MAQRLDCDNHRLDLHDGRDLIRDVEHLVVVGDQAVESELGESDKELTIAEVREPWVDVGEVRQVDVLGPIVPYGIDQWVKIRC